MLVDVDPILLGIAPGQKGAERGDRKGAGSVGRLENEALPRQRVESGGQPGGATVGAEVVGPQSVDGEQEQEPWTGCFLAAPSRRHQHHADSPPREQAEESGMEASSRHDAADPNTGAQRRERARRASSNLTLRQKAPQFAPVSNG